MNKRDDIMLELAKISKLATIGTRFTGNSQTGREAKQGRLV